MDKGLLAVFLVSAISVGLILSAFSGVLILLKSPSFSPPASVDKAGFVSIFFILWVALIFIAWSFRGGKVLRRR